MDNQDFLNVISQAYNSYLSTGSRSNSKLKVLHGAITQDLSQKLGPGYQLRSLGFGNGKEERIRGRYLTKVVDITISNVSKQLCGVAVKYVMNNYSQNSINYFESMLGETANIRTAGKAYFQILILPEVLPYFTTNGKLKSWQSITQHNLEKYLILSKDNTSVYLHTPQKSLIYLIKMPSCPDTIQNKKEYLDYYQKLFDQDKLLLTLSHSRFYFDDNVILNNYEDFSNKIVHYIKSL